MTATIHRFPPQLRRVPDDLQERQANMAVAMQLGLIAVRRNPPGYVPLAGRVAGDGEVVFEMQLGDGE